MESLLHDISWVLPLRGEVATVVFRGFSALGYLPFYLVFLPLVAWLWEPRRATRLAMVVMATALLNAFLKDWFADPRPALEFALDAQVGASYGLPSGHAQMAVVLWGWLAWEVRRGWCWALAAVMIVGIGFSRLYLGVHDLEDVLAGTLLGLLTLPLWHTLVVANGLGTNRWPRPVVLLGLVLLVPVLLFSWPQDRGPGAVLGILGFMIGWVAGRALDERYLGFERHRKPARALLAAVGGVAAIFGLVAAVPAGLEGLGLDPASAFAVLAVITGLLVTALGPWLFQRTGLAGSRSLVVDAPVGTS